QPTLPRPSANTNSTTPAQALHTPTNQDIEAVIQMATSNARANPTPPRDTRTQLFVGNLPYRVRWQDLKDLFRKAGTVLRADVSLGPDNRSRGFGTVLLASAEDAGRAIDMFNGYSWQTRILEVRQDRMPPDPMYDANAYGVGAGSAFHTQIPQPPPLTSSMSNPSFSDNPLLGNVGLPISVSASVLGTNSSSANSVLGPSSPTQSSTSATAFSIAPHLSTSSSISRSGSRMGMHSSGRSLFVGNLPFQCQWQDLKDLFRQIGPVVRADVALGPDGRSRGFGTVLFQTEADADRAVKTLNGFEYNGRMIKVHHDRFTQTTTGSTSPPPFTGLQPHMQLQQATSYLGTNPHHQSLIPSHIHTTAASSLAGAPFHSQPTSPFDGFLSPMQLAPSQQQALYEQYLNQQQQIALQQPPVLQRSVTEQVMGSTGTVKNSALAAASLAALQQELLAKQLKEQVETLQQVTVPSRPAISQTPSVAGSRPSTSHGSVIAGSTRPASAMSSAASSAYGKLDYPSLFNPPPAPTPPTITSMSLTSPTISSFDAGMAMGVLSNLPKGSAMEDEIPHTPLMNQQPSSPTSNHPGTIAMPPRSSAFAGGMMFSPLGRGALPPMTPSMPGFTFHPQQVGTPPGMLPHFLSPGIGPTSPPHFTPGLGRQGSFHAAPGGPMLAMMYGTPPVMHTPPLHAHHPHMMLTPGPRLESTGAMNGGPVKTDTAATIRARVAGITLDETTVPNMVNEIAVASGLGTGTTAKQAAMANANGGVAQNGKMPSLWMSQRGRFSRPSPLSGSSPEQEVVVTGGSVNAAAMGRNASGPLPTLNESDMIQRSGRMFSLPSPGRRASWAAEPGSKRPEVVATLVNEADSR
ncbi:hypothetical protein FRB90_001055, partial [Tulasnella sp. 427]